MMKRLPAILLLLLIPAAALAQEPELACGLTETYGDCLDRLVAATTASRQESDASVADRVATAAVASAAEEITKKAVPEGTPDAAGAIRDFLPLFFSSLGLGGVQESDAGLTLTFNPDFLQLGPDNPLSLQAIVRNPAVFDALVQALPEDIRADRKSTFEDELQDFDDVEMSLAWSRESERFGRDASNHKELISRIFLELTKAAKTASGTSASKKLLDLLALPEPADLLTRTPADVDADVRARLDSQIAAAVREITARQRALEDLARKRRFFDLDDLVNNQPQILVSANYRHRADLVGPDETFAKASFEMGFANVNGLKKHCRGQGKSDPDSACLETYLKRYGSTLRTSPRLEIEGEYSETAKYGFSLPEDDFAYNLDRIRNLTARATLGSYLLSDAQGNQTTRADLEAVYEDVSGDDKRNNRFVATLTFTQRLTDDMATTLSAVWANRPQYRGEVDEEVSARFGLKYKIDRNNPVP